MPKKAARKSAKQRRSIAAQVQEYVDRYLREIGKVAITISPGGQFASFNKKPPARRHKLGRR